MHQHRLDLADVRDEPSGHRSPVLVAQEHLFGEDFWPRRDSVPGSRELDFSSGRVLSNAYGQDKTKYCLLAIPRNAALGWKRECVHPDAGQYLLPWPPLASRLFWNRRIFGPQNSASQKHTAAASLATTMSELQVI